MFQFIANASKNPPTYTIKDPQSLTKRGTFYEKELNRIIWEWVRLQ